MGTPVRTDPPMSAEAYMAWYDLQPEGKRYELLNGVVYEMQSERAGHARTKLACAFAFSRAIAAGHLPCEIFSDGMALRVDEQTIFEPDMLVRCGPRVPDATVLLLDACIVVEVLSPTNQHVDVFRKFNHYMSNTGIMHYLILNCVDHDLVHHRRTSEGRIESTHLLKGTLILDPPGLSIDVSELFAGLDS